MAFGNMLTNAKFYNIAPQTTGNTDEQAAEVVDMDGYDGVLLMATAAGNTNTTGGYSKLYVMHASSSETTSMVSCTGTAAIPATTAVGFINSSLMLLDVVKPLKRYVSATITKDSTNEFDSAIHAIQYNIRKGPVVQPTTLYGVIASAVYVSPTS